MLLGGREDFFIQTALPEQDISSAAPKDDEAGAVEWQQGFKVCRAPSASPQDISTLRGMVNDRVSYIWGLLGQLKGPTTFSFTA